MKVFKQPFLYLSLFSVLITGFIISSYVFGWTSPSNNPPGGTVYTPIDVSSSNQAKQGYLAIGTSTTPSYALDIYGVIRIGQFSSAPSGVAGSLYYDTTSNKFKGYNNSGWTEIGGTGLWTASGTNIYYNTGNIGIGTSTPSAKLDIYSSTIPWNALGICKNGVCCPIWKDCDADGKTYGNGDCDESCPTCYVDSVSSTASPDGKDQNCDGVVDNLILLLYMAPSTYSGNLGGRSGADSKCDLGAALGCSINRAFISVSATDEIRDMPTTYNIPTDKAIYWYNRSTGLITLAAANNWADLLDGSILASQSTGTGITKPAWMGGNYDGSICTNNYCTAWTSTDGYGWIASYGTVNWEAMGASGSCSAGNQYGCVYSSDIALRCVCASGYH